MPALRRAPTAVAALVVFAAAACQERAPLAPDHATFDLQSPSPTSAELIAVGRAIFFDENLSLNGNQSCASCHDPAWGWTGPNSAINAAGAVYEGSVAGRFGNRKPPSSAYATLSPVLHSDRGLFVGGNFWDGRATGEVLGNPAADQAQGPFLNPVEQALATPADVVSRVCAGSYGDLFQQVWGTDVCEPEYVAEAYDAVALSIAAFEGSDESNAFSSKYDLSLRRAASLTKQERRGLSLFKGKGKCAKCHVLGTGNGREPARFTDFTYDNLGLPKNPANPWYGMPPEFNPDGASWTDYGLGAFLASRPDYALYAPDAMGMQKVPTLRNVDRRPATTAVKAYGHNGYFKTLWQIVHFYNTRDVKPTCADAYPVEMAILNDCWPAPEVPANVNDAELGDLRLTFDDEIALVAFLKTLSDGVAP
ncbi:MAG: cytochrome C [Gemmatimonadota bacterium]|nr:cytochrome C [Gemmatimonadota bacterium]